LSSRAAIAGDEGAACEITADCAAGLRCVEGACVSVSHGQIAPVMVRRERTAGDRAWIGDGRGYVAQVVVGDVAATVLAGSLVAIALTTGQGWFAFAALFPTTLTGPLIHAANGRGGPAAVSFFAWAAVPPTLTFFAFMASFGLFGSSNGETFAITGYSIGIGAAVGLTALDAFFARTEKARPTSNESFSLAPVFTPARGGFTAGVGGTF